MTRTALVLSLLCGCNSPLPGVDPPQPIDDEFKTGDQYDLGVVVHPLTVDPRTATGHTWTVPPPHTLRYGLGKTDSGRISNAYRRYRRRMRVRETARGFSHHPPARCRDGLRCVYNHLITTNQDAVLPIAQRFLDYGRSRAMTAPQLARVVITWAQNINYRLPADDPYGIHPPALVVDEWWGDCDSKSLLVVMILRMIGIQAVMLESRSSEHTLVGVGLPVAGDRLDTPDGNSWAVVEITQPNWPIGRMPPTYRNVSDWRLIRIQTTPGAAEHAEKDADKDA